MATADPWITARNRYIQRLDPEEAVLFKEATIQNLYYGTSNADREDKLKSKTRHVIAAVQPLVDKIEDYGKAMDAFANIAPTFLAPIWGGLRVILVLASNFGRFYDKMTDTLGRIGDILPRLYDYQRIFSHQKHPKLTEALASTYLDIIELCMEFRGMIKAQQKNILKRALQPLSSSIEEKFKDAEARFRAHRKAVEKEAETCHMIEAAEARAIVLRDRQLQEMNNKAEAKKKLLRLLSICGSQQKHEKVRSVRHAGTGSWLFANANYKKWNSLKGSAFLCCYGIPGCGKTVLASSVIDSLLAASKIEPLHIGYHYCDYADKRTLEPITILGTIARSLLESVEVPAEIIELIYSYYRDGDRVPETKEVIEVLSRTIGHFNNVVLAIDGIDEIKEEDRLTIYEALKALTKSHHVPVKVFLLCREDLAFAFGSVPGATFRVQVSEKAISTDIEGYIRHSVQSLIENGELVIRKAELEQSIVKTLIDGAKGMFLWVKFQLDELCTAESDNAIKKTLRDLPKDLSETYDRLLGRIVGVERQELVKRMFRWIVCARRPLAVDELCEGIAFTIDDTHWNEDKIPTDILRLIRACGNLVIIDEESKTVQLAHYTVQQYILNDRLSREKFFHFNTTEADELLGEVCVAYLNFSDFETQVTVYVENNVTAGMTAMEKAFANAELAIPSNGPMDAISVFARIVRHKAKPTNIDYSRHIPKKTEPVEHLLENYRLLGYIRENWLWHTARFLRSEASKARRDILFHKLVLEKQLPFSFRPWRANANVKMKYPYLEPVGWALVTNHCPLIETLLKTDPTFEPWKYFVDAAWWFFEDRLNTFISEEMLERIKYCAQDTWDSSSTPAQGWIYSRMLDACRRGNIDILLICMPDLLGTSRSMDNPDDPASAMERDGSRMNTEFPWFNIRAHLVIEAAVANQKEVIDCLMVHRTGSHDSNLHETRWQASILCQGLVCNALESSALAGQAEMARYLRINGWRGFETQSQLPSREAIELFQHAVHEGNYGVVDALLEVWTTPIARGYKELEDAKLNALIKAAATGNVAGIHKCLKHGIDPLKADAEGSCAYMRAIRNDQHEAVETFLAACCGVETNVEGLPLSMAASVGNLHIAELLVAHGASVFTVSSNASDLIFTNKDASTIEMSPTPLYAAAANGHRPMVEYLLGLGAAADTISPTGLLCRPAKHITQQPGELTRRRLFYSDKRAFEIRDIKSAIDVAYWQRPLAGAAINGQSEVVKVLIKAGVDLNKSDSNGNSCLFLAACMGHSETFQLLRQAGAVSGEAVNADRQLLSFAECQFLSYAGNPSRTEGVKLLLDLGISPNTMVGDQSALFFAVRSGAIKTILLLLNAGAEVERGKPPFREACNLARTEAASILIDAGAQIYEGRLVAHRELLQACRVGHLEIVQLLLSRGASVEAAEFTGYTPLFAACESGHLQIVKLLLSAGANPNAKLMSSSFISINEELSCGTTPLILAAIRSNFEIVQELLLVGAEKEERNVQGQTALLCATMSGDLVTVNTLVNSGASLTAEDSSGRRILEIAVEKEMSTEREVTLNPTLKKSLGLVKYLIRLHDQAMQEVPPRFIFTSKDSGEALRYAMKILSNSADTTFSKGIQQLVEHYTKAKEFQIDHQQGRLTELIEIWKSGVPTSPEDQRPFDLDISSLARVDETALLDFQKLSKPADAPTSGSVQMLLDERPVLTADASPDTQKFGKGRIEFKGSAGMFSTPIPLLNTERQNSWDSMLAEDISVVRTSDLFYYNIESQGSTVMSEGAT